MLSTLCPIIDSQVECAAFLAYVLTLTATYFIKATVFVITSLREGVAGRQVLGFPRISAIVRKQQFVFNIGIQSYLTIKSVACHPSHALEDGSARA